MSEKLRIDSSLVLSERGTSTPIGANRMSFSRLMESSVGEFDITRADDPSTPKMKISSVPIFGRRNLLLLNEHNQNNVQSSVIKIQTPQKQKLPLDMVNVEKTFEDHVQPSSSAFGNKKDSKGIKTKIAQRNKRRSNHNDSHGPVLKVAPKGPKSPRLLTAMRARMRANRDKLKTRNVEMVKENEKKTCPKKQEICTKPTSSAGKPSSTIVYSKYKVTVPLSPKLRSKKTSRKA